jgi:hypothetical protein
MKLLISLILLLFLINTPAQNIYNIPAGSSNNKLEIKINNTTDKTYTGIILTPSALPEWVKVKEEFVSINEISPASGETAVLTFDVSLDAPLNSEEELSFLIQTKEGKTLNKTFSVKVTLPDKFELNQNFPNPFNPSTVISFSIPSEVKVILKVYNILGEEVQTLVNEVLKPGVHNIDFNASHLASGVYFYRIDAGNYTSLKKMILMK